MPLDPNNHFDFGYHSHLGAIYVMVASSDHDWDQIPTRLLEQRRVEIYPADVRPNFWRGKTQTPRHVPEETNSADPFEFIKSRLDDCTANHPLCRPTKSFMPRRLLRIGSDIKLVELDPDQEIKYAALCHRWGWSIPLITTRSTIDQRKHQIEWSSLPAAFQDAVTVCSDLGIEYLWIDALCMIQGDENDWALESKKMSQIYRNAYITIFGPQYGVWQEHFLAPNLPKLLTIRDKSIDGTLAKIHLRVCNQNGSLFSEGLGRVLCGHDSGGVNDSLLNRGWSLQECDLSTRRIMYSFGKVKWACKTMSICECLPHIRNSTEQNQETLLHSSVLDRDTQAYWENIQLPRR
ncbi:heterokaryon incompatibility protein-domain-containing protein [Xylaria flabelliformis]|nr:heterokaryon incompatibility protein-domain-containing protein [Xylaria flabelliformis]